jgi:endoglucanase
VAAAAGTPWVADWFDAYNTQPADTNPSGPAAVRAEMDAASAFASRTGRPVYLGAFAAFDWADAGSRARFYAELRAQAEAHGFGWAVWDDGGHGKFLDVVAGDWSAELHQALFAP